MVVAIKRNYEVEFVSKNLKQTRFVKATSYQEAISKAVAKVVDFNDRDYHQVKVYHC